ncbi:patatin-domain-containing protein [Lindgomyces ingoldianus]|uniref:Patatin-domain-containing protein n=1 Tax=Lindgomyces ingoldianus TaxID=673940 RepID=A0ACB6RBD0_9PLEO|nr:patatin-domain-containing protein [Lindgomyces ingoldianus]KAF2476593.1 patatin-domain-containing protein [Lindgomyces ingoldianus]
MSFLCDTILPGGTRLHLGGEAEKYGPKALRKSQSHGGLLAPLVQLVRDPVRTIGSAVGSLSDVPESTVASEAELDHKQVLYLRMRNAESYEEWKSAATELDTLEGNDVWKLEDDSPEYDAPLVAARLKQLDDARLSCDVKKMLFLIRTALTRGLGGMGDLRLYKHSHVGTKALIERYIDSAQNTMTALLDVSAKQGDKCPVEPRALLESLLAARQSFGRSALLLSGGGTFGMNHIGVVKSLWKARLLPRIISGASAGSIVCAVLCTKTDAEIPIVLEDFCYGDLAVFEKEGEEDGLMKKAARFLKYGALFDISHLVSVMRSLLGDITFQESYNRTRRILNITVSSASLYELPRLLNYVTAPNVMIWSAVCASCSVPFVFSAASLSAKDPKTGKEVPWNPTPNAGWIDGSVDNDLPMTRLAEMFNVNHFIVSQVNPHVVPFLAKEEEVIGNEARQANTAFSAGPTWIHNMANLAKGEALHRLQVLAELGIFPNYLTKARSVLNQRYSGDITIFPAISYAHFPKVLSNPTTDYMLQCMLTGERATWSKLSRVQNHVAIELSLDETIRQFRARIVFSPSQVDLRMNTFNRPLSQGDEIFCRRRSSRPPHKITRFDRDTAPSTSRRPTSSRRNNHPLIKIPPQPAQVARPYLPSLPLRKFANSLENSQPGSSTPDAFSSSTNFDDSSSNLELSQDTDASDFFSSSLSPPNSPSSQLPTLWPSTRQLFPSVSQPSTPSISTSVFGHRNSSLLNLTMTSDLSAENPSPPEIQYKHLFHPSSSTYPENPPVGHDIRNEIENTIQPCAEIHPTLHKIETFPETQHRPPTPLAKTDPLPESLVGALEAPPNLSSAFSPLLTRDDGKAAKTGSRKLTKQEKKEIKEAERDRRSSRRGSAQGAGLGLLLDISGTRGMMRRKKSSKSGNVAAN